MIKKSCRHFPVGSGASPRILPIIVLPVVLLCSCGIESYYYLPEVPAGNITTSTNQWASINLPSISQSYFSYFALYYRIYISYEPMANIGTLAAVNPTLNADYQYLSSYTNTTTPISVNVASIMSSRGYQPLFFRTGSGSISNDILDTGGGNLRIEFPISASPPPYINFPGGTATLQRSNGSGTFNPLPDRYFLNTSQLNDPSNISQTVNADVVNAAGSGAVRYAYASLYIVSAGLNEQTYTPIFSIPTFVGIFRLP
ncbi:MAG: hypothetical protein LBL56_02885 [Treponema sp.]|nr:hypothetical protein [Treponema sp.]